MISFLHSATVFGIDACLIDVEVDISSGLPIFSIVGLPDTSVKESRDRVISAIKNSGFEFLSRKVVINLSPANIRKEGSTFDLPIAIGILIATENIVNKNLPEYLQNTRLCFQWQCRSSV